MNPERNTQSTIEKFPFVLPHSQPIPMVSVRSAPFVLAVRFHTPVHLYNMYFLILFIFAICVNGITWFLNLMCRTEISFSVHIGSPHSSCTFHGGMYTLP